MLLSRLDHRVTGKVLGHNIYDESGRTLLRRGVTLTPRYIARLRKQGYLSVYVLDELVPDLLPDETIDTETRGRAIGAMRQLGDQVSNGHPVDMVRINGVIDQIVDDLKGRPEGIVTLSSMKTVDDYTFEHSVNVCILTAFLWWNMHGNGCDLLELARGALMHDIGKLGVPLEILLKPGKLTEEEYVEVQRHAEVGYNVLRDILPDSASPLVAKEHHERIDGSGYPEGRDEISISMYGRMGAVADVYDAITSDRVYRNKMRPHEAMSVLERMAGTELDAEVTQVLIQGVAHYPVGSRLLLDTGEIAVVVEQDPGSSRRPRVRIVTDAEGVVLRPANQREISLSQWTERKIVDVLEDYPEHVRSQIGDD